MANEKNLKPFTSEQDREEAAKNGRKGGLANGENRRRKKLLKECLEILLENNVTDKHGATMTGAEAMAVKAFQAALKGDWKAWELCRDTSGQKPVEKVVVSEIDNDIIDEVERMINDDKETSG